MTPPVIGAAIDVADLSTFRDWLFAKDRDLEIQDFYRPAVIAGDWRPLAEAARDALQGYKGRIGIHGPFFDLPLDAMDAEIRAIVTKRLATALEICAVVGANQVVIHSPVTTWNDFNRHNYPNAEGGQIARVGETLAPVLSTAEAAGITFVLENIEDRTPETRRRMVEAIASPALRLSVDTGHAHYAHGATGGPPADYYIRDAGPLLEHVHLQDADGYADRHWQIGTGTILWPAVFAALREATDRPRLLLELRDKAGIPASMAYLEAAGLGQ